MSDQQILLHVDTGILGSNSDIGVGGDAEVLVSAKDAKNAQLITGKQQTAGVVENRDTMVEKGHKK